MQIDMHYYGTYAIARAAGLKPKEAKVIAYSAQFVDDSVDINSEMHEDGGMLYGIATAHRNIQVGKIYWLHKIKEKIFHRKIGNVEQRSIWVPFHFYPGNEGNTFSKKLICRKNSPLVNEMFDNHIECTKKFPYILQLIGIASHVYMDTFSHYGFSGKSSRNNKVKSDSFSFENDKENHMKDFSQFNREFKGRNFTENWRNKNKLVSLLTPIARCKLPFLHKLTYELMSYIAEKGSGALGHGAVATFPDRPYLKWSFSYEDGNETSERSNPHTYLEGCENLYLKLKRFSHLYYDSDQLIQSDFSQIKESIKEIFFFYGSKEERVKKWISYIQDNKLFNTQEDEFLDYDEKEWENQKTEFHKLKKSSEVVDLPIYLFHQAADYHRHYTLKQLLPKYGIIVN